MPLETEWHIVGKGTIISLLTFRFRGFIVHEALVFAHTFIILEKLLRHLVCRMEHYFLLCPAILLSSPSAHRNPKTGHR